MGWMLRHESQNKKAAFSDEEPQFQHTEELVVSEDPEENSLPENRRHKGLAEEEGWNDSRRLEWWWVCEFIIEIVRKEEEGE